MNTFTNREEYLAAVKQWRAEYEQLSTDVRTAKQEYKDAQREFSKCEPYNYNKNSTDEKNKEYLVADKKLDDARSRRSALKDQATNLLKDRHASKIEAARQTVKART